MKTFALLILIALAIATLVGAIEGDDAAASMELHRELYPYENLDHRVRRSVDQVRGLLNGDDGYRMFDVTLSGANQLEAQVTHVRIEQMSRNQLVFGDLFILENPLGHFSIEEPTWQMSQNEDGDGGGGCALKKRSKTSSSAHANDCVVATNAGFFDTRTGACLGDVVSNGRVVQEHGYTNAAFGVDKQARFVVGYLPETMERSQFLQLVQGVVVLVRDASVFVEQSLRVENMTQQETGNGFATIQSARTAIGHDSQGRLLVLSVNGKSWQRGISLYDMANIMISAGAVNAINLDGGGSATVTRNGIVSNYPSDECSLPTDANMPSLPLANHCERAVSTITCFHSLRRSK
jgi:N-acetylglucosamine-1-phosphodiester alpha-N-acetylglucosaminidase